MAVLINSETRIVLQGDERLVDRPSPSHPPFFASNVVGRVASGADTRAEAGRRPLRPVPVFASLEAAVAETGANVSVVLATPEIAPDAIVAAVEARMPLVVAMTPDLPPEDRRRLARRLETGPTVVIGPGPVALVTPGACHIGTIPRYLCSKGQVGILSQSAALASQAAFQTSALGLGQSTVISVGYDPVRETSFLDCLKLFLADDATKGIVLLFDEDDGIDARVFALLASRDWGKPVVAHAGGPENRIDGGNGSNEKAGPRGNVVSFAAPATPRRVAALRGLGVSVVGSAARIGIEMKAALEKQRLDMPAGDPPVDFAAAMRRVEREIYRSF